MQITIENIATVFRPFIDRVTPISEMGSIGSVLICLKEGYVLNTTGRASHFFSYAKYQSEYELEQDIDRRLSSELIRVTFEAWNKGEQITTDQIVDHNPAKLFRSGIVNYDYEVEVEAWIKVSNTYSVSAPNKTTAEAVAVEVAKGDNRNLQDRDQLIFSVRPTDCKKQ